MPRRTSSLTATAVGAFEAASAGFFARGVVDFARTRGALGASFSSALITLGISFDKSGLRGGSVGRGVAIGSSWVNVSAILRARARGRKPKRQPSRGCAQSRGAYGQYAP